MDGMAGIRQLACTADGLTAFLATTVTPMMPIDQVIEQKW